MGHHGRIQRAVAGPFRVRLRRWNARPAIVRWRGKIPAGKVTDEIFAALDWLSTLARMAGETGRVPADRPIAGVDSSDLLLGRSDRSNRDHVLFHGSDGGIMSVKWKTMKAVFRYAENREVSEHQAGLGIRGIRIRSKRNGDDLKPGISAGVLLSRRNGHVVMAVATAVATGRLRTAARS
jgi:hypothetical protein